MNRKEFFETGCYSAVVAMTGIMGMGSKDSRLTSVLSEDLVKEFVVAGHKDLMLVKDMLTEYPELLHVSYHWGNGDYEMAIEGAAHVGNKAITLYLIDRGARVNLFVLTMLGKTDLVIPTLKEYPQLLESSGPHGFSLLHHAKMGGEEARPIFDYLIGEGLTETKLT